MRPCFCRVAGLNRLSYAYQEDDVFVSALVNETERRTFKCCEQLSSQYNKFWTVLNDFQNLMKTKGKETLFTQSWTELKSELEEITQRLRRYKLEVCGRLYVWSFF